MEPVYIDFHIHTSDNPEQLNTDYPVDTLIAEIEKMSDDGPYLISISDHNTINSVVYLKIAAKTNQILVGAELHIRNFDEARPYHCHIIFNLPVIDQAVLDDLNEKLDYLYPNKVVAHTDISIPKLEQIMNCFDEYEFLLLPHGGQNHATFDISIPAGVQFDRTLERSIYYNHFDGFTARSPYYFDQSYISKICDPKDSENKLNDISILQRLFPTDDKERLEIVNGLAELGEHFHNLIMSVKEIESCQEMLSRIPKLSHLIVTEMVHGNPLKKLVPTDATLEKIEYPKAKYDQNNKYLNDLDRYLESNPFVDHDSNLIVKLLAELDLAYQYSELESSVRDTIAVGEKEIDDAHEEDNEEVATKRQQFESLIDVTRKYLKYIALFQHSISEIAKFKIEISTKEIESMGHKLFIENEFQLTKEKFLEVLNGFLKRDKQVKGFEDINPECLFAANFKKKSPKVENYDDLERRVKSKFEGMNNKKYKVVTSSGKDIDSLSAGWKTSVILDLILGWADDNAPLIIDQPEDNLATGYINYGLLEAIKKCKSTKQIILVSHNATIPMLGDAQNIIFCQNIENKITVQSSPLEGEIDGVDVVDLVANTTDGGKASVKKRVKKYNLKNFRGTDEAKISQG